jgi:hypothetical protein
VLLCEEIVEKRAMIAVSYLDEILQPVFLFSGPSLDCGRHGCSEAKVDRGGGFVFCKRHPHSSLFTHEIWTRTL